MGDRSVERRVKRYRHVHVVLFVTIPQILDYEWRGEKRDAVGGRKGIE